MSEPPQGEGPETEKGFGTGLRRQLRERRDSTAEPAGGPQTAGRARC